MKILRFKVGNDIKTGFVDGNSIREIRDFSFSNDCNYGGRWWLEGVKMMPPSEPTKIIGIGLNYMDHIEELKMEIPKEPLFFYKPPSSLIAHGDTIEVYVEKVGKLINKVILGSENGTKSI